METIVSSVVAPVVLFGAVAAGAVYYTNGCTNKPSKKAAATKGQTVSKETTEEVNIDELFPEKKQKKKPVVAKKLPKIKVKATKQQEEVEEEEDYLTFIENSKKEAKLVNKQKPVEKKPEVVAVAKPTPAPVAAPVPEAPKKPLTEVEKLKQRIMELENAAKKKAEPKKAADFNPAPVLTKQQQEEQEQLLKKAAAQNDKWVEVSDNKRQKKEKKPEMVLLDLNVMTITAIVTVTQADRRTIAEAANQISAQCECKIELPQRPAKKLENPSEVPMKIELEGAEESVAKAKKIITDLVTKGYSPDLSPDMSDARLRIKPEERSKIVGERGIYIKKITEKTGVSIDIPKKDDSGDSAVITIVGPAAGVAEAKEAIRALVLHGFSALTHEDWQRINVDFAVTSRKFLLSSYAGQGPLIHKIQDLTGCKISFPEDKTKGEVVIVGPSKSVYQAADYLSEVSAKIATPVADVMLPGFESADFSKNELW